MANTTNYSLPLIDRGAQDWKQAFDQIIESIDNLLAVNQMPANTTLQWGDVVNGNYLQVDSTGIKCVGNVNFGSNELQYVAVHKGPDLPSTAVSGQLFFKTADSTLYVYSGASWIATGALTSASVKAAGGIVSTDVPTGAGTILTRSASGDLTSITPSGANKIPVSASNGSIAFSDLHASAASLQAHGSLRVGSGAGTEDYLALPSGGTGKILAVDESESLKVKWEDASTIVPKAFSSKGQIVAGTGSGTASFMSAPKADQILVGDTDTSSGWTLKNISDIVGQNNAEASAFARVFANSTFG